MRNILIILNIYDPLVTLIVTVTSKAFKVLSLTSEHIKGPFSFVYLLLIPPLLKTTWA